MKITGREPNFEIVPFHAESGGRFIKHLELRTEEAQELPARTDLRFRVPPEDATLLTVLY